MNTLIKRNVQKEYMNQCLEVTFFLVGGVGMGGGCGEGNSSKLLCAVNSLTSGY